MTNDNMNTATVTVAQTPLPRIGMGCWAIGGPFWNGDICVGYSGTTDTDSRAALAASWDAGVRLFDTAAVYGAGHSETLLGDVLSNRDDAFIVSKLGNDFDPDTKQMTGNRTDPAYIRQSVDDSRRRLQRDRIDVMLLHINDLPLDEAKGVFDTLEQLVDDGALGAFGWSTDFPENASALAPRAGFVSVQHAMNVFFDAPSMSATCAKHGLAEMIRSPLAMGLLTGKYSHGQSITASDIRNNPSSWARYFDDGVPSADYLDRLNSLRDCLTVGDRTLAQGALCWLLAANDRTIPLPGAKNAAQAEENARALEHGPLPETIMAEIETILVREPEGPAQAR